MVVTSLLKVIFNVRTRINNYVENVINFQFQRFMHKYLAFYELQES